MAYLKFSATQLFDGSTLLDGNEVLIMTGEGVVKEVVQRADAGDDIRHLTGILSPGFINCHCHLELSHMKGAVPEHTGLVPFVWHVITNRHSPEEEILQAIANAEAEMLEGGIMAVGDICNNLLSIPQKRLGKMAYRNFIEASGFVPAMAGMRFKRAEELFDAYEKELGSGQTSIVPHAPYSVSDALWEKIIAHSGSSLQSIHNQESAAEDEFFREKLGDMVWLYEQLGSDISWFHPTGRSSLQSYFPHLRPPGPLLLVHNVHSSIEDIRFAENSYKSDGLFWCLCPNANLYISNQLPDIGLFTSENVKLVLGTDSLASNHQLSILAEMRTIRYNFPELPLRELSLANGQVIR